MQVVVTVFQNSFEQKIIDLVLIERFGFAFCGLKKNFLNPGQLFSQLIDN